MESEPLSPELQQALYKNELDARFVVGFVVGMITATTIALATAYWPQISTFVASLF